MIPTISSCRSDDCLKKSSKAGFTLLELMIVVTVMAMMMGFVGFSLLGGGGASLGAAQRELVSLVQQARMQASLSGRETRLIVHDDPGDPEKFHRYIEIVVEDVNDSASWRPLGEGTYLDDEACIVPDKKRFNGSVETSSDVTWPSEAYSMWSGDSSEPFKLGAISKGIRSETGPEAVTYCYLAFDNEGKVTCPSGSCAPDGSVPSPRIVLGVGSPNPAGNDKAIRFNKPDDLTGILVRAYGGFATLSYDDLAD